jgi:glycosyltransferase involved in cell wall biosynthesis
VLKNDLDVSLVIPAYNEETAIDKIVARVDQVLRETALRYEIIVVNDGSWDTTWKRALNLSMTNNNVRVIGYDVNQGKGYAIIKGFLYSRGDAVIFIDPSQISSYFQALKYGDLVIASKRHPQSVVKVPLLRRFLSYGFHILVQLLTGLRIRDTQTGLKAVRRKALEPVFSVLTVRRFAFDVELLTIANLYGLKIIELPVKIRLTNLLFSPFQMWKMFVDLLGISYRLRVRKWYQSNLDDAKSRS